MLTLSPLRALLADRSGRAVAFGFVLNSVVFGSWVPRVPDVMARLGVGEGALGLALLGVPAGAVLSVTLGGRLVDRVGPGRMLVAAAVGYCAVSVALVAAPTLPAFALSALAFGLGNGLMDVAMNAEAVAVEGRLGRRVIAACHAGYSLGAMAGAALGAAAAGAGVAPVVQQGAVAGVLAGTVFAARALYLGLPHRPAEREGSGLVVPRPPLVGLAAVVALVLFSESSMADWSAAFLRQSGAGPALAGLGYAAFSGAMAVGRLVGDGVAERVGPAAVVRGGLLLAAAGLGLGVASGSAAAAVAGFGCAGLGLAGVIPTAFRAAAQTPSRSPGAGVASVASAGYLGIVCQSPVVGRVGEAAGLGVGYGVVVAALVAAAVLAPRALRRAADPA